MASNCIDSYILCLFPRNIFILFSILHVFHWNFGFYWNFFVFIVWFKSMKAIKIYIFMIQTYYKLFSISFYVNMLLFYIFPYAFACFQFFLSIFCIYYRIKVYWNQINASRHFLACFNLFFFYFKRTKSILRSFWQKIGKVLCLYYNSINTP